MDRFADIGNRPNDPVDPTQLGQPTLVMWGRQDALISVDIAEKFAEALPDASLLIYDDVGHLPMEEIPTRSAADVLAFLSQLHSEPASLNPQGTLGE